MTALSADSWLYVDVQTFCIKQSGGGILADHIAVTPITDVIMLTLQLVVL